MEWATLTRVFRVVNVISIWQKSQGLVSCRHQWFQTEISSDCFKKPSLDSEPIIVNILKNNDRQTKDCIRQAAFFREESGFSQSLFVIRSCSPLLHNLAQEPLLRWLVHENWTYTLLHTCIHTCVSRTHNSARCMDTTAQKQSQSLQ